MPEVSLLATDNPETVLRSASKTLLKGLRKVHKVGAAAGDLYDLRNKVLA
jgi:hypothetical protein